MENRVLLSGLSVTNNTLATSLVSTILGTGVTSSNATLIAHNGPDNFKFGDSSSSGTFTGGNSGSPVIIGFESGIILSTGGVQNVTGTNDVDDITQDNTPDPGDLDLDALAGVATFDATVLEFDFVPVGSTVSWNYVFSSEEYNEFVDDPYYDYNDVFAFYVNGVNAAVVPLTTTPITVETINNTTNSLYYRDNEFATTGSPICTEMDGLTVVLTATASVNPGVANHIKLAIADGFDPFFDSNVFIEAASFTSTPDQGSLVSLGDRVWVDIDGNGQQDTGESGAEGILVTLIGAGPDGDFGTGDDTNALMTTDVNGEYSFLTAPGDYRVKFSNLPTGFVFTDANVGPDATDSDADPVTGITGTYTLVSGQPPELTVAAGILQAPPGIEIVKDVVGQTIVAPNTPVTYTYSVTNTGGIPLSNITVTDDNATLDFVGDDFAPRPVLQTSGPYAGKNVGDLNGDNLLDTSEIWKYTATVIPPVVMTVSYNSTTWDSGTLSYDTLPNGDIRVYYRQSQDVNDNNYADSDDAPDWNRSHKFNDLVGSDKAGFLVKYSDGTTLVQFYQDYISASSTQEVPGEYTSYSGYRSLGATGGDGKLVAGNGSVLKDFDTTLELNLNRSGYTTQTVNSPIGDANWDYVNGYYFTISASAFTGGKSFGGVTIFDQHNSPSKVGTNSLIPDIVPGASVNTTIVVGYDGDTPVTNFDDATVSIVTGPLGSLGDRVWLDLNANGVQNVGENGISGVKINLTGDFDQNGSIDYTATATTDANGIYHFAGLPAGEYRVTVDSSTLPANVVPTYDLDGLVTLNTAIGELATGQNRVDYNFGYVPSAPGFSLVKSADKLYADFGESVTYTYLVSNSGSQPLTGIDLNDDNATPSNPVDDFKPNYVSGDGGIIGQLDPGETWTYTATVTPPIQLVASNVNGYTGPAGMLYSQVLSNGDIRITYRQNTGVNDNNYCRKS